MQQVACVHRLISVSLVPLVHSWVLFGCRTRPLLLASGCAYSTAHTLNMDTSERSRQGSPSGTNHGRHSAPSVISSWSTLQSSQNTTRRVRFIRVCRLSQTDRLRGSLTTGQTATPATSQKTSATIATCASARVRKGNRLANAWSARHPRLRRSHRANLVRRGDA